MQLGFYLDQTRCTGCYACVIACKDWHEAEMALEPENWIQIKTIQKGSYPDFRLAYLAIPCLHCEPPACEDACPNGAIEKREKDGVVVVNPKVCMGSRLCETYCKEACPYDVPRFGCEDDAKMQKCDLCYQRLKAGKTPICVEACPMFALDAGPVDMLQEKYSGQPTTEGFTISSGSIPAISFKQKLK